MRRAPLLALVLAGCGPLPAAPSRPDALAILGDRRDAWEEAEAEAVLAFGAGRWEEAGALYERKISLLPPAPDGGAGAG